MPSRQVSLDPVSRSPTAAAALPSQSERAYQALVALMDTPEYGRDVRLPGEEAMSQQFGVSRPVLRQALARLRSEGRIYTKKGAGNFVSEIRAQIPSISYGTLASIPDVRSFLEFRCSLEGESAALAAEIRDRTLIASIQMTRKRLELAFAAGGDGIEHDIAFHLSIAQATGNRFFAHTLASLADPMRFSVRLVRDLSDRPLDLRRREVIKEHGAVADAIAKGRPDAARTAMVAHLQGGIARLFGR
jgi:GntR family transcriptional repressor for pyruvate dehydrogenase complex